MGKPLSRLGAQLAVYVCSENGLNNFPRRKRMNDYDLRDYDFYLYYEYDMPTFDKLYKNVHMITDVVPYWSQAFLILALAIERYILIVKGVDADRILSKRNRKFFYFAVVVLGFVPPVLIMAHFGNQMMNDVSKTVSDQTG